MIKLLLALDGTHRAEELLAKVAILPTPETIDVLLLHCLDLNSLGATWPHNFDELVTAKQERCQAYLDREVSRLCELGYAQARSTLRVGPPRDHILGIAEAEGVDAIVLQTHGRGGLEWLFMGSVAEGVIRRSHCPVLVLPADPPGADPVVDNLVL